MTTSVNHRSRKWSVHMLNPGKSPRLFGMCIQACDRPVHSCEHHFPETPLSGKWCCASATPQTPISRITILGIGVCGYRSAQADSQTKSLGYLACALRPVIGLCTAVQTGVSGNTTFRKWCLRSCTSANMVFRGAPVLPEPSQNRPRPFQQTCS